MKYVLAVSGGIDSVALLDMVANETDFRRLHFAAAKFPDDFIVAHFDHGIRGSQSHDDAEFVRQLAGRYGVRFVLGRGELTVDASEERARTARYQFLHQVCGDNDALLVTAHHRDDVIETVVMNLIRGTGWRGLAPMSGEVIRPLTDFYKADLVQYALEHDLNWVQDQTNYSPKYFRNRVRMMLGAISGGDKDKLFALYSQQVQLRDAIDNELMSICRKNVQPIDGGYQLGRYFLIMVPLDCGIEILRYLTGGKLLRTQLLDCLLFIRTALPHKQLNYKKVKLRVDKQRVQIFMIK